MILFPGVLRELSGVTLGVWEWAFGYNLYVVCEGRLIRAGSMPPERLRETIGRYGIRTVLDLRQTGGRPGADGKVEGDVVREAGARYVRVGLWSRKLPSKDEVNRLILALRSSEKPILVHCVSGQHRAAFAAAVFMLAVEGRSLEEALGQLSARYGYFALEREISRRRRGRPLIEDVLWRYSAYRERHSVAFEQWLEHWEGPSPEERPDLFKESTAPSAGNSGDRGPQA